MCRCFLLSLVSKKTPSWQFLFICNSSWLYRKIASLLKATVVGTWNCNYENVSVNWEVFFGYVQICLSTLYAFSLLQNNEKLVRPFHFVKGGPVSSFCKIHNVMSIMSGIKCLFFLIAGLGSWFEKVPWFLIHEHHLLCSRKFALLLQLLFGKMLRDPSVLLGRAEDTVK